MQLPEEACDRNKAGGGCEGGGVPRCWQAFPYPGCLPGSGDASLPAWLQGRKQVEMARVFQAPEQSR